MKRFLTIGLIVLIGAVAAQAQWKYEREIKFPVSDTAFVSPFLCTVDANGRLYVASSQATTIRAHNAIYYANPGDAVFTRMIDYELNGDSDTLLGDVGRIRGIGSVGTDILMCASVPTRRNPGGVGTMYYYPNGDTTLVNEFGFYLGGAGYGTFMSGVTLSKDTIAFTGITFNTSIRLYNFGYTLQTPSRGSWIPLSIYPMEPGGYHTNGLDVIRDCAVDPTGDYTLTSTPWYTSRNSLSSSAQTGGIAVWTNGSVSDPGSYTGQRAADAVGFLNFGTFVPVGITVDHDGYLWVARGDSAGRAVKAFDMTAGIFASEVAELPGQSSPWNPDPAGAPMLGPVDVAVTADMKKAYVIDNVTLSAFEFSNTAVGVGQESPSVPATFSLEQNYPNPFNPTTTIGFTLSASSDVKLVVTNSLGQEVGTLVDGFLPAGKHVRTFTAPQLATGAYFYTLTAGAVRETRSMVLVK